MVFVDGPHRVKIEYRGHSFPHHILHIPDVIVHEQPLFHWNLIKPLRNQRAFD